MKKRKIKWKNVLILIGIIISLVILFLVLHKVIFSLTENNKIKRLVNEVRDLVIITEDSSLDKENIPILDDNSTEDNINYYYEYIKVPFMRVNFKKLLDINKETVGWLKITGTDISYPFVQTNNNEYYVEHSFDKSVNKQGWIFADYRSDLNKLDENTIIYAHSENSLTMLSSIKDIYDKDTWYKNKDNYYIKISTETSNTIWKIFSLYKIETTNDYLDIDFSDSNNYLEFIDKIKKRSYYEFDTVVGMEDKILTLSTCYNKKEKIVIHAKLFKQEEI